MRSRRRVEGVIILTKMNIYTHTLTHKLVVVEMNNIILCWLV